MENLDNLRVFQELFKRSKVVNKQRINCDNLGTRRNLHQAKLGEVGFLAKKLRINCKDMRGLCSLTKCGKFF